MPLIVINIDRLDLKAYSIDDYCWLICFTLEYIIQNMMIPG